MTIYRMAQLSGIQQTALHRFMAGDSGLSLKAAEELARVLGLELLKAKRKR